jgi:RNA polymerase sigma-70 factor (sigma-E family)
VGTTAEQPPEFAAEFDRLFERAYAVARRLIGDPSAAEDVAAEALTRTYVHWNRVRGFEYRDAWVARVATNLAIKASRRRPAERASVTADPSDATALRLALVDALARLPRRQREAVALRYLADLTIDDVALTLGVSAGTVKQSVHRALHTLRGQLGSELPPILEEA